jgi:glc operon protein GlcG
MEKARTAALARRESKIFEDMINGGRTAFLSAPSVCSLEGAVPLIVSGRVVGAVGVSGATASEDAKVARAGADSVVS